MSGGAPSRAAPGRARRPWAPAGCRRGGRRSHRVSPAIGRSGRVRPMARHSRSIMRRAAAGLASAGTRRSGRCFPMLEPVEERDDVGAAQRGGIIALVRRCSRRLADSADAVDVILQHGDGVRSPPRRAVPRATHCLAASRSQGWQIPVKSSRFRPWPKTAVFQMSLRCSSSGVAPLDDRLLQFLTEPPDMPWQLRDVEVGDRRARSCGAGGRRSAAGRGR